jgi:catechol 2,3-dioxygenase-like lactoylglutathione lyase family enzyme
MISAGACVVTVIRCGTHSAAVTAWRFRENGRVGVRRVVPDLRSEDLGAGKDFYANVLGLHAVMDPGWIVTLADRQRPDAQISLMTHDETAQVIPDVSIEVDDVDARYAAALKSGAEIVHPLTDEPWGVRRFFVRDPDGHVINVLSHPQRLDSRRRFHESA